MDLYKRSRRIIDIYQIIKNKVMGLLDKQKNKQAKQAAVKLRELTPEMKLKYLITLIGKSEFKGSDLQIVYSITAKITKPIKKISYGKI